MLRNQCITPRGSMRDCRFSHARFGGDLAEQSHRTATAAFRRIKATGPAGARASRPLCRRKAGGTPALRLRSFGKMAEQSQRRTAAVLWRNKANGSRSRLRLFGDPARPAPAKSAGNFAKSLLFSLHRKGIENMRRVGRKPRCKGTIAMNIAGRAAGWSRWRCCWPDGGIRWRRPK